MEDAPLMRPSLSMILIASRSIYGAERLFADPVRWLRTTSAMTWRKREGWRMVGARYRKITRDLTRRAFPKDPIIDMVLRRIAWAEFSRSGHLHIIGILKWCMIQTT